MTDSTRIKILKETAKLFALSGYEGFSMRTIAKEVLISQSVLYHYFPDKDALLRAMFDTLNTTLGHERAKLPIPESATEMLRQRIEFQLDHAEEIVAVLKYYLAYRKTFPKFNEGYVPDKSSLHIEEVLKYGQETGEFYTADLEKDAKVITHAINGFLLEYYPKSPRGKGKKELIDTIHSFLMRALTPHTKSIHDISNVKGGEQNE